MWSLAIHGGAGDGESAEVQEALNVIALHASELLSNNVSANEVVVFVISSMESLNIFNAGITGSVKTPNNDVELDASIMRGDLKYGSIIGTCVKHPIALANRLMHGLRDKFYNFYSIDDNGIALKRDTCKFENKDSKVKKYDTVGCVIRDTFGNMCSGSSTGGISGKPSNRFGDSPMIGHGTYADNKVVAVTVSGIGETLIPHVVSFHVWALMKYVGMDVQQALDYMVNKVLPNNSGGIIAIDSNGRIAKAYNTNVFQTVTISGLNQ